MMAGSKEIPIKKEKKVNKNNVFEGAEATKSLKILKHRKSIAATLPTPTEKKKFDKNSSFHGFETKKSPKSHRKSIHTVLPTPVKKKKVVKTVTEWEITEHISEQPAVKSEPQSNEPGENRKTLLSQPNGKAKKSRVVTKIQKYECTITTPKCQSTPSVIPKKEQKLVKDEKSDGVQGTPVIEKKKRKLVTDDTNPNSENASIDKKKRKKPLDDETNSNEIEDTGLEKFGIKYINVAKAVKAVIKLHKENPKLENQLFDDPIPLSLKISCHKVLEGPSRIIRIPLPNSVLTSDSEVCLIVSEVAGIKNIEHEKHVEHYENLLRSKGVENIKKIMTFHEFRTEYETFEQKLRLVDLYDRFLVDGKISGKVVHKCGKIFYKKRKVPTPVKLQATQLKSCFDKALAKAFFFLHLKGDSYNVEFGHDQMKIEELVENVFAVIEHLDKEFPGGFKNIKGIHVSAPRAMLIPIYASLKNPNEIKVSKIKSKRPKAYKTYQDELSTLPDAEVIVKPTGNIIVKRLKEGEKL